MSGYVCGVCSVVTPERQLRRIGPDKDKVNESRIWACPTCTEKKKKEGWFTE